MSGSRVLTLLREKRVIVVCGAGGVGKTTSAAVLALTAARANRRVLVITIDPSKRLAQTLGVSREAPEPSAIDESRQRALGIDPPGSLSAWMLDPQVVADRTVRSLSPSPEAAELLLRNRVYRNLTSMVAGMQEYTAVESLHDFVRDDRFDLVVLDTPPSRDALRFLDAPSRVTAFLDRRVLRLFAGGRDNRVRRAAGRVFERLLDLAFGAKARLELQQFFQRFEPVLQYLNRNQAEMRAFLTGSDVAFLLVTTPRPEALEEAFFFEGRTRELGLPLEGYLLNRSRSWAADRPMPSEALRPPDASPALLRGWAKLAGLAEAEAESAREHEKLRRDLADRAGPGFALALSELAAGASDLESLVVLAESIEERGST